MRIYTRTGDEGETGLLGGVRVPKDDLRVAAYGEIDELNAQIGLLRTAIGLPENDATLATVQHLLFEAGTELATPPGIPSNRAAVRKQDVRALEDAIDRLEADLDPLNQFILPGGSESAGRAHLARCVCRRAERAVVHLLRSEPAETEVLVYLNRLSDYLFVLARWANRVDRIDDVTWESRGATPAEPKSGGTGTGFLIYRRAREGGPGVRAAAQGESQGARQDPTVPPLPSGGRLPPPRGDSLLLSD